MNTSPIPGSRLPLANSASNLASALRSTKVFYEGHNQVVLLASPFKLSSLNE